MRLGQLSRKLGVSTSEIIDFLASQHVTIDENSNTKIEDEHATWVTQKYAPHLVEAVTLTLSEEKDQPVDVIKEEPIIENSAPIVPTITEDALVTNEEPPLPEIIKAPKIELSGLKVLGKIELPEKKKKEISTDGSVSEDDQEKTRKSNSDRRPSRKDEHDQRPRKNPVALQREREEREAERRRKEALQKAKEKKALHYQSKVKTQVATKRIKMIEEPFEKIDAPIETQPNTWWGKFMKWLRT
jgi:hypothetical protein